MKFHINFEACEVIVYCFYFQFGDRKSWRSANKKNPKVYFIELHVKHYHTLAGDRDCLPTIIVRLYRLLHLADNPFLTGFVVLFFYRL
jgi:hypothetical protein